MIGLDRQTTRIDGHAGCDWVPAAKEPRPQSNLENWQGKPNVIANVVITDRFTDFVPKYSLRKIKQAKPEESQQSDYPKVAVEEVFMLDSVL